MIDLLNLEINGISLEVKPGTMVIEAADEAGIVIPRFCYHKKLSIAANCRMCLVQVEKAPKPLPACATPVTDGMKVFTKSPVALQAQKSVMEFLLINHPLDCPICDQGGECDLQDIAMGFGGDSSRFHENKRVVRNKNLGSLISTDMTRCIHCTRCVRFGQEVAGIMELGAPGRGEHTEIGTYMERAVSSEMSGNVIDLCPVGALTSKPYRYTSRPWENTSIDAIAPHDCVGSNIHLEVRRNKVMRVLPKENEAINEVWLSDRDRYSYTALLDEQRLAQPMIKQGEEWREVDWQTALSYAVEGIKTVMQTHGATQLGSLLSPGSTLEEMYLMQKLLRALGSDNVDHRLRQTDFRDEGQMAPFPYLGQSISDLENLDAALLIGSFTRKDQPIINHRLRKAGKKGAAISVLNSVDYDFNYALANKLITSPADMVNELAAIVKALAGISGKPLPAAIADAVNAASVTDVHSTIAQSLHAAENATVLLGVHAAANPHFSALRSLANAIREMADIKLGYLSDGANSAGGWLAGAIPHRLANTTLDNAGKNALQMISEGLKAFILLGIEPEFDCANHGEALDAMKNADFVVSLSAFVTDNMRDYADVILPVSLFSETSGTYVNVEGKWQSFSAAVKPYAEARPAWKVLRVLGNFFQLAGFDYISSEEIRNELDNLVQDVTPDSSAAVTAVTLNESDTAVMRIGHTPLYAVDALVRRSQPLQATDDAIPAMLAVNQQTAEQLGIAGQTSAVAIQNNQRVSLPIYIEDAIPDGCVFIPSGVAGSSLLGLSYGAVDVSAG